MKKVLFVMNNLKCGGAEKALISLLESFDYKKYEVDLFIFSHEGIFMKNIPSNVTLLNEQENYKYFSMPTLKATYELLHKRKIEIVRKRLGFKLFLKGKNQAICEQQGWKYVSVVFNELEKEYDVAIGYLEKNPIYFCVEKVKAIKKIGWVHNDYRKLGMDSEIDNYYFGKLNYIFTVSKKCLNVLQDVFPQYREKFKLMHNIVSCKNINELACEEIYENLFSKENVNIVSLGRLTYQKGFDTSIKTCKKLVDKGYPVRWYIIGEGDERKKLQELIQKYDIQENFKLIGIRENPYPYIKGADIYVQTSRFEGKSIAIDEAKILNKPIIITNFTTAKDQINDGVNGLIAQMESNSVSSCIENLINDVDLRTKLVKNLSQEVLDNKEEIRRLYEVM